MFTDVMIYCATKSTTDTDGSLMSFAGIWSGHTEKIKEFSFEQIMALEERDLGYLM